MSSEAYDDIRAALKEYHGQVEGALSTLSPNTPGLADLEQEAGELMEWALQVLLSARARTCDQLDSISAALCYASPSPKAGTLKVDV